MNEYTIRRATRGDAADIARIYNHYIVNSIVTFDSEQKTVGEREAWLDDHDDIHPAYVALDSGGDVIGWASVSAWASRPAWRHTVEVAVYLSPDSSGRGLGPALLGELIDACRRAGHHALMARIVTENVASLKMVERAGFERVGTLKQVGRKFDQWLDVAEVELLLDD